MKVKGHWLKQYNHRPLCVPAAENNIHSATHTHTHIKLQ